jgi:polyisoprenoid-binding protein YceI
MKNLGLIMLVFLGTVFSAQAQKYFTRDGSINFSASTPMETIDATSKGTTAVIDAASGALEFAVLVKGFIFEKALMQEHFNENYIESDKFPKATFKGKLVESTAVNWTKDGSYPIKVKGKLNIHGVEKDRTIDAVVQIKGGKIRATSEFDVTIADHDISIPSLVQDKISKVVKVKVDAALSELKK